MYYKLSTRLALSTALAVGVMAASVASASAATTYDKGNGAFEAVATLNPPPEECATYRLYNAELALEGGATATVSSERNPTSPDFAWGEFATGTFESNDPPPEEVAHCDSGPGAAIGGFTGTLTDRTNVCVLTDGTYKRGALGTDKPELNVQYEFETATGPTCGVMTPVTIKASIPSKDLPEPITVGPFEFFYLSACDSPIAPQSCVLGPANHSGEW